MIVYMPGSHLIINYCEPVLYYTYSITTERNQVWCMVYLQYSIWVGINAPSVVYIYSMTVMPSVVYGYLQYKIQIGMHHAGVVRVQVGIQCNIQRTGDTG